MFPMKKYAKQSVNSSGIDAHQEFIQLSNQFSQIGLGFGLKMKPYNSEYLPYYSKLPAGFKKQVLEFLKIQIEIFQSAVEKGIDIRNTNQISWEALKRLNLKPAGDLFDKIKETDFLELYDLNVFQIFRDINFYGICGYTIEDLLSRPLQDLVARDVSISKQIMQWIQKFQNGEIRSTIDPQIPIHLIQEIDSDEKMASKLHIKYYSPLFDEKKKIVGIAVVANATEVQSTKKTSRLSGQDYPSLTLVNLDI